MAFYEIGKKTQGKDFNFFQRIDVNSATFSDYPSAIITFSTNGILFLNEGSGVVEVSFNGNTVHTELNSADSTKGIVFDNRTVSMIWLRVKSGGPSISVRIEAW
jgi:Neuraminidase (sialidase)